MPPRIVSTVKLAKWRSLAVEAAMAVVVLGACGALIARSVSPGTPAPPAAHTVSLLTDGRSSATLRVLSGTPVLKIAMADLHASGTLLRVTTPGNDQPPQLRVADGNNSARSAKNAVVYVSAKRASAVTITLNEAVGWRLDLAGGTTRTVADLRGGQVTGIAFTAGSDVIDLTLPQPAGSVPVLLAAGASQFRVSLPIGVKTRVTAAAGAGEISLEDQDHIGVAAGSVFTTPGWTPGAAGFDIDATAGAAHLTVTARVA